jgi:hypothetical protein
LNCLDQGVPDHIWCHSTWCDCEQMEQYCCTISGANFSLYGVWPHSGCFVDCKWLETRYQSTQKLCSIVGFQLYLKAVSTE